MSAGNCGVVAGWRPRFTSDALLVRDLHDLALDWVACLLTCPHAMLWAVLRFAVLRFAVLLCSAVRRAVLCTTQDSLLGTEMNLSTTLTRRCLAEGQQLMIIPDMMQAGQGRAGRGPQGRGPQGP